MNQYQQQGEPDSRPLFVEVARECPECQGLGRIEPEGTCRQFNVCETCNGSGDIA